MVEGILLTGDESEVEYTDDSGIRFDVQGAIVGNPIRVSKSKLSDSWKFACSACGRENDIDTDDLKIALGEKFSKVAMYQRIGKASKKLDAATDFLGLLIERAKILKEYGDKISNLSKSGSALIQMKCYFCGTTVPLAVSAKATSEVSPSIIPTTPGVLFSEQFKEDLDFQVFESDLPERIRDLVETRHMAGLLEKYPLNFKRHERTSHRLRWGNDKPASENAEDFASRIQSLQHDIERTKEAKDEAAKSLEAILIDQFETSQAKEVSAKMISHLRLECGLSLQRKLQRLLLANLAWLTAEIQHAVNEDFTE